MDGALDPMLAVVNMRMDSMKFFRLMSIFALVLLATRPLHAELADGVKAVVSDAVITYSQVEEFTAPAADALRRQYSDAPDFFSKKWMTRSATAWNNWSSAS